MFRQEERQRKHEYRRWPSEVKIWQTNHLHDGGAKFGPGMANFGRSSFLSTGRKEVIQIPVLVSIIGQALGLCQRDFRHERTSLTYRPVLMRKTVAWKLLKYLLGLNFDRPFRWFIVEKAEAPVNTNIMPVENAEFTLNLHVTAELNLPKLTEDFRKHSVRSKLHVTMRSKLLLVITTSENATNVYISSIIRKLSRSYQGRRLTWAPS